MNKITLELSKEELKALLRSRLKGDTLLDDFIISQLEELYENEYYSKKIRFQLLFNSLNNISPEQKYPNQSICLINIDGLSAWTWDKDRMVEKNMLDVHEKYIKGRIKQYKPWYIKPYEITYSFYNDNNSDVQTSTHFIEESYISKIFE